MHHIHNDIARHATILLATVLGLSLGAQIAFAGISTFDVSGKVRSQAGVPIPGARITIDEKGSVLSDEAGVFSVSLSSGRHLLRVSEPAHISLERTINVRAPIAGLELVLLPLPRFTESVVVSAVRADSDAPVTKRDIDRPEIESTNYGQEMPFLLKQVPSITQYADSGAGTGYSYLYLRGIQQSRMNITLDGVPLNESEDSALYFANFGDFTNAIESIQVQRGVGTSTVGAASFVGSINFASIDLAEVRQADLRVGTGSFGTHRMGASFQSGRLGDHFKFYGQAAYQESAGFRDHSGNIQQSLYLGATRDTTDSFFKLFGFHGHERSQLAYLATDEDTLRSDLRFNPLGTDERDSFGQSFVTAQYHRAMGPATELSVQGYYNGAGGWYRIRDAALGLLEYGLDWRMLGATSTLHAVRGPLDATWGIHVNDFESQHVRDIVDGPREYTNHGFKNEVNTFAKLGYTQGRWHHYADFQLRWARFRYDGSQALGSVAWTFFNPKLGTRYDVGHGVSLYGSIGRARREPARSDMLQGEDNASLPYNLTLVKPEQVINVETGIQFARAGFAGLVNAYFMEFRNEIAQTGELSEIGLPLRRNVDRSHRRGMEVDLLWQPTAALSLRHIATYSRNRINRWTQFYDIYDASGGWAGATSSTHYDVPPLLTPSVLLSLAAELKPIPSLTLGATGRYVGRSHLDNTGSATTTAPGFFNLDASASLDLGAVFHAGGHAGPKLRVQLENLLNNRRMFPSGYSYLYFVPGAEGGSTLESIRYYYPLATRSVFISLDVGL